MSAPAYGRYQVAEPPSSMSGVHLHAGGPLKVVDHEPKVAVLDQSDLHAQGIHVPTFIKGAKDVDALGSCTAQATTSALSNVLHVAKFVDFVENLGDQAVSTALVYTNTAAAERAAIGFYHAETMQTGDPAEEWPPTDCGSSGPFIVDELKVLGYINGAKIAHGAQNIVSLMQTGGILIGSPWLNAWEQPNALGFIDGTGTLSALEDQIRRGIAGGHETFLSAIEKLTLTGGGLVDPFHTILRIRNSWGKGWGDHGSCLIHLSTLVALGQYIDFRQLVA